MNPAVLRSRSIREAILRLLRNTFEACPDVGCLAHHIYSGFGSGRVQYDRAEIDAELADLVADKLITVANAAGIAEIPEKIYHISSRGRDFVLARFPWGRVDEYTGEEKPA